ncbi:hypothetical protein PAXRUDRAFT_829645 [Paxillus rubicundulus Ve08.2h10]|uniref:Uncharacterized protein n=1 Tax=Paxillus rubicundulus Ve08.2h10 TaxID=930991 RepID=A0A0D0DMD4_9AGAM|nr:hypothetical protein PAXRUDRAFT_829645 [Paxillus rubicundulus Ve08.2h10]
MAKASARTTKTSSKFPVPAHGSKKTAKSDKENSKAGTTRRDPVLRQYNKFPICQANFSAMSQVSAWPAHIFLNDEDIFTRVAQQRNLHRVDNLHINQKWNFLFAAEQVRHRCPRRTQARQWGRIERIYRQCLSCSSLRF